MPRHFFTAFALSGLAIGALAAPVMAHDAAPMLLEGSLVRSNTASQVYYIQAGQKRVIASAQAFNSQGFRWSDITTVDAHRLGEYPDGPVITADQALGLKVDPSLVPDLAPTAPYDLRYAIESGRTRLRFTAAFVNRGRGQFELRTNGGSKAEDGSFPAFQRLFRPDGTSTDHPVGSLFWHKIHQHYHYDDFGEYSLELVDIPPGATSTIKGLTDKTTYCMRDDEAINVPTDGPRRARTYNGSCGTAVQGVSVGWADVYKSTLPDQYFDVTDLPAGVYKLSFSVDPDGSFVESRRDNNISTTVVELDPAKRTLKILATASAYASPVARFTDGMRIRAEDSDHVYVMSGGKKRLLRDVSGFVAYGMPKKDVYVLPDGAVDAIPEQVLVRVGADGPIYALNAAGTKRRILTPQIMSSYGWSWKDVASISQAELDAYPQTDLIMRQGDASVFSLSQRRSVGSIDMLTSLGLDPASVHGVNTVEFQTLLGPTIVAQGLVVPWDIGLLPDGDMLVTERTGDLRRIGHQSAVMEVPGVMKGGEGGLMGIAVDPSFADDHYIYLYYTTLEGGKKNRVTRFRLEGSELRLDRILVDNIPSAIYHDGGQIEFGPDGKLYVATGDSTQPNLAQDTRSLAGKILRVNADGTIPSDNPFGNAVWSYGHRNPQGFAWDAQGRMYATEHGPTGEFGLDARDEVNRIEKGGNYGWPVITGDQKRAGMISPLLTSGAKATWAPSGMAYVNGKVYFSGLRGSALYQATVTETGDLKNFRTVISGTYGRLRAVVPGPGGSLYLTTSNRDGRGTVLAGDDKVLQVSADLFQP